MGVLEGLKPERVFYYFEKICGIPHGSYNVQGISDYIVDVARSLDLEVRQDETLNVVIKKPASEGYGPSPVLMLQGHMDMVCVKDPGTDIDLEKEAIRLMVEDGFIHADHTSLGGDDGIAVAMGLALLEDDTIAHPPLEVVFTTQEEVGMDGALALDTSDLKASALLNLDSEAEGILTVGCAGGAALTCTIPAERESEQGRKLFLDISGLTGGHSGSEIDKERANANVLLGRLLFELERILPFALIDMAGGEKDNAIADGCKAQLLIRPEDLTAAMDCVSAFEKTIQNEYRVQDPGIRIKAEDLGEAACPVIKGKTLENIISLLFEAPYGVQAMSMDMKGLVETSLNLGILKSSEKSVCLTWSVRSCVASRKKLLLDRLTHLAKRLGGTVTIAGDYPEWPYNPDSRLYALIADLYEKQNGKKPAVETIHAGLECGILGKKMPGLDMVSIGPDILDIHTTKESLDTASVARTYELVLHVLKEFGKYCG